ncbi:MAG: cell division protein ZapB [Candidatus Aminicenantes bacterium]|nr:cell division protein ZapB [Candidatus Aminicenantes bacterium]
MTSELERIKILEGKISHVVDYVNKLTGENEKLKQQIKELRAEKRSIEDQVKKSEKLDQEMKKYESEKEILKEKIEGIISQIDKIGL